MSHTTWLHSPLDTDNDVSPEIKDMVKEKGSTCVSIIVPTHRLGQDRLSDIKEVQRAILVAKQSISIEEVKILSGIDDLFEQIDFSRNKEGIGIFVSPHIKKLVRFPFPVTTKIIVDKLFHLADLLYLENYSVPYYLVEISGKEIRLFRGVMDHLQEIIDGNFRIKIVDDYEYSKPSQSSSTAGSNCGIYLSCHSLQFQASVQCNHNALVALPSTTNHTSLLNLNHLEHAPIGKYHRPEQRMN